MQDTVSAAGPTQAAPPNVTDGLPPAQRRWAMLALGLTLAISAGSSAIANIALPAIALQFGVAPATAIWVVNVYQIAMVASLLPFAALGDIVGHQRIYYVGLALFTVASLACALAWSFPSLLIARTLQGLGASGLMSINTALVAFIYPKRMLGRGLGLTAMIVATSLTIGPTLASGLLLLGDWTWLFAINVPFGIIALVLALKSLPQTPKADHGFDLVSAALSASALGLFIAAIGNAGHSAETIEVVTELAIAIGLGWFVIRRQAGHPAPMLPVDLYRRPIFALSSATAICSFTTQGLAFIALPFYFQDTLHLTAVATGLLLTPWPLVVAIMAPVAGRLADRHSAGLLCGIGLIVLAIGMGLLALLPKDPSVADIAWRTAVCGCGFGFFQSPNLRAIINSAPRSRSGAASGAVATSRLIGQTLGAALTAVCFSFAKSNGPIVALALGTATAAVGSAISFLRLVAR